MRMRLSLAASLALAVTTAPAGAQEAGPKGDRAKLQGKWSGVAKPNRGGYVVSHFEFKGDRLIARIGDIKAPGLREDPRTIEKAVSESRVILDETTSPKQIRFVEAKMIEATPGSLASKVSPPDAKAVYDLDGDTFRTASFPLSDKLPNHVSPASGAVFFVYVRGDVPPASIDGSGRPVLKDAGGGRTPKKAPKGALAALQGTWTTGEGIFHGHGRETLTIQGDAVDVVGRANNGNELHFRARIKLNENASPGTIDFVDVLNGNRPGQPTAGIYELDGDILRLHKSYPGKPRAGGFDAPTEQGKGATWARGAVAIEGRPTVPGVAGGRARDVESLGKTYEGREFPGATVVKFSRRNVLFQIADGRQVDAMLSGAKGFDIDGTPRGRGDELLKPGNVVDVTIAPILSSKIGLQEIVEFRLVRVGDGPPPADAPAARAAPAPAPAPPAGRVADREYRGAVILDVTRKAVVLSVAGKKVNVAPTDKKTRAFDSNGRQLDMFTQSWVLVKGNTVDVVLEKPGPGEGALPAIIEIRLVEGQLKDVPRYLDAKPGGK